MSLEKRRLLKLCNRLWKMALLECKEFGGIVRSLCVCVYIYIYVLCDVGAKSRLWENIFH